MNKLWDKLLGFLGAEVEDQDNEKLNDEEAYAPELRPLPVKAGKDRLVSLPHPKMVMKVAIVRPTSFEQVQGIADNLKSRRPVLVNLEQAEKEVAKRIIDFVSGTTYALGGTIQKVSQNVFLFCPNNVEVVGELSYRPRDHEAFSWPGDFGL